MRKLKGVVASDKMNKTVVVRVDRLKKHPKYLKYFRLSTRLKAHDEKNEYRAGDKVIIQEDAPRSREKRWKVVELVSRQEMAADAPTAEGADNISREGDK